MTEVERDAGSRYCLIFCFLSYFGFVTLPAADDRFLPTKCRCQMDALDNETSAVLCHPAYAPIDAMGERLSRQQASAWEDPEFSPARGDCFNALLLGRVAVRTGLMLRRSFLNELGGFDESYRAEDLPIVIRAARSGPIAFVDAPQIERRLHGANWTFRFLRESDAVEASRSAGLVLFKQVAPAELAAEAAWRTAMICVVSATNSGRVRWAYEFMSETLRLYPELRSRLPRGLAQVSASFAWNRFVKKVLPNSVATAVRAKLRAWGSW